MKVFCEQCEKKLKDGRKTHCAWCSDMISKGFIRNDEYVNSLSFSPKRWGLIGSNSSPEAMMEVHRLFKTQ